MGKLKQLLIKEEDMNNIEELHESVNDIYYQLDEGKIDLDIAVDILLRVCKHFIEGDIK